MASLVRTDHASSSKAPAPAPALTSAPAPAPAPAPTPAPASASAPAPAAVLTKCNAFLVLKPLYTFGTNCSNASIYMNRCLQIDIYIISFNQYLLFDLDGSAVFSTFSVLICFNTRSE